MDANIAPNNGYIKDKAFLAVVSSYDESTSLALMTQRNKLVSGEACELLTPGRVGQPFVIDEIYDENMTPIESTPHPYMKFYARLPMPAKAGDIVRAG